MEAVKGRRQEYAELTRAAVVDAAAELFARQGYAKTSLEEVAAAARVSKGTVYGHFDGKEQLFRAALEDQERQVIERLATVFAEHADPWDGAVAACRAFLDACRDSRYGHIVMREGPAVLPYNEWLACAEPWSLGMCRTMVTVLIDAGVFTPMPVETATRLVHSLFASAAVMIAEADEDPERQAVVREETEQMLLQLAAGLRKR
ncbi:MAG: TetR/AcrR family transcriptional regulator [Actinomycetes bacterium]